jgi:hypothetical protein
MPPDEIGWEQAQQAGDVSRKESSDKEPMGDGVHFIVSPHNRTVGNLHGIVSAWCDPSEFNHTLTAICV